MWIRHPNFINLVQNSWNHNLDYEIAIENFTISTKRWNKETFGNILKQNSQSVKGSSAIIESIFIMGWRIPHQ